MHKFYIVFEINNNYEKFRQTIDSLYSSFKFDGNYQIIIVSNLFKYQLNEKTIKTLDLLDDEVEIFLGVTEKEKIDVISKIEGLDKNILTFICEGDILSEKYFDELNNFFNENLNINIATIDYCKSEIVNIDKNSELPFNLNGLSLLVDFNKISKVDNLYKFIYSLILHNKAYGKLFIDDCTFESNDSIISHSLLFELISCVKKFSKKLPTYVLELSKKFIEYQLHLKPSIENEEVLKNIIIVLQKDFLQEDFFSKVISLGLLNFAFKEKHSFFEVKVTEVCLGDDSITVVKGQIYAISSMYEFEPKVLQNKMIVSPINLVQNNVENILDSIITSYTFEVEVKLIDSSVEIEFFASDIDVCTEIENKRFENGFEVIKSENNNSLKIIKRENEKKFLVSCIIPIYNVEKYL
ncbi:MAG: hypothetical protein ACK5LY_06475, partial [Lachnospirales bacterium]